MIGSTLGPYRIDAELGSGGMGRVYAATITGRALGLAEGARVALKVVHSHLLDTPGFFKRFLREGEIGRAVLHENVVRTLDCDAVGGHHFLVMEYVEGQTLRALLEEIERVPEELCRHIGREVATGLAAIHATGAIHRDLKPENVLITKDHVVKVMDLGVARLAEESLRLSQSGAFVGSVEYAAPEQFGGRSVGPAADLHALGVVLYELATARHPYKADDIRGVMRRILDESPRRCAEINPQLSPFFEEIVYRLLAKRPEERFASAGELVSVLDEGEASAWWKERAREIRVATRRPLRRVRIPRETALFGRDGELAKLRALYDDAKTGEGRVVLFDGEAGIGKSRLVDEFVGLLHREGEDLNYLYGSYPPGGAATASGAFCTAYREHFGETDLTETLRSYLTATPVLVPAFAALLCGATPAPGVEPLTKDALQTVFVQTMRSLAAERPTIVTIDDLHFAPEEGLALFAALALAVPGHRVLLVGTTRPGLDAKWLANVERMGAIRASLARLGPKDLARLLADAFRSERLAEELGIKIALKSDGNPFFVFEILRGLRDGQFITKRDDGTWATTRVIEEIQIPSTVLDLVNARVADLDDDERNLLDVAACVGFEFDPLLVASALGMPGVLAMQKLARIEKKHRLVRSAGRRLVFDHHQVEEALYGALPELLREAYHAEIGSALEATSGAASSDVADVGGPLCVELCAHFLKGAQGVRALRYLGPALAHLESGYLNASAVALAERALAVEGLLVGIERAKVLFQLCRVKGPLESLGRLDRREAAARETERIAESVGDLRLLGRIANVLGATFQFASRTDEAEAALQRAHDLARSGADHLLESYALTGLGLVRFSQDRLAEAASFFERTVVLCVEIGERRGEAVALSNLGELLRLQGRRSEAVDRLSHACAICREIRFRGGEASATGTLGNLYKEMGRLVEAREYLERALAIHREVGNRSGEAIVTGNLGNLLSAEGRPREAREHHARHLAICREIRYRMGEAIALHNLGAEYAQERNTSAANEHFLACLAVCEDIHFRHLAAATHLALGSVFLDSGDESAALGSFRKAREEAAKGDAVELDTLARCRLACLPGGDSDDALDAFEANTQALSAEARLDARWFLWRATGDRAHLVEAKRLLSQIVANVPDGVRASMLANVRLNREIMEAARAVGV